MAKKGMAKSAQPINSGTDSDFLPLEGGPARKIPKGEILENGATIVYVGRIPHGFYEDEMEGFFKQFGTILRLKIARNRKTGKSKHYGFIEFEYPEVAKIVAECMHNYLMFEHMLQVYLIPPQKVHPKLWKGVNRRYKPPVDFVQIERKKHNKVIRSGFRTSLPKLRVGIPHKSSQITSLSQALVLFGFNSSYRDSNVHFRSVV